MRRHARETSSPKTPNNMEKCYESQVPRSRYHHCVLPSIAHATEDFCVVVSETPDGFLALREGPSAKSKMIAKLRPRQVLSADTAGCSGSCNGGWMRINSVYAFNGKETFTSDQTGTYKPAWVAARYTLPDDECTRRMYEG